MIESALYEHLQNQERLLSDYLASYGGKMAIFNQEAPADTDEGWQDPADEDEEQDEPTEMYSERVKTSQYGRLVFAVDLSDDPERKYSGTLSVDVLCEKGVQLPEEIEPIVRALIDGYFFSTEEITMAAQWSASNYFTEPTNKIIGVTLTFGLLAFPKQTTIDPDPIALLNEWSSKELKNILMENLRVIGHDPLKAAWKPTNDSPAVYWRLTNINPCSWIPDTYHCSWHTAVISGHILAPDKGVCASIARKIDNILTLKRRLIFDDKSPLMVDRNIRINLSHDPMKVGQITLDATYGILRQYEQYDPINNVSVAERRSNDGI